MSDLRMRDVHQLAFEGEVHREHARIVGDRSGTRAVGLLRQK